MNSLSHYHAAALEDRARAKARIALARHQRETGDLAGAAQSVRVARFWQKAAADDLFLAATLPATTKVRLPASAKHRDLVERLAGGAVVKSWDLNATSLYAAIAAGLVTCGDDCRVTLTPYGRRVAAKANGVRRHQTNPAK